MHFDSCDEQRTILKKQTKKNKIKHLIGNMYGLRKK